METTIGLPNTCCQCGKPVEGSWFARNKDEARSGQGFCAACIAESGVTAVTSEPAMAAPASQQWPLPDFLKESDNLSTIPGLGSTSAKKLKAAGIASFGDLRNANAAELSQTTGIQEPKIEGWIGYLTHKEAVKTFSDFLRSEESE
jgi:predicted flap endonuclease-1-like 5' DNA nuclease